MAYTRINWENSPSTNTPRNATNLNKMDKGIYDLAILEAILEAILGVSTDTFSDAATYAVNSFTIYENKLWKCTTAVTVAGAWTGATNWEESSIIDSTTSKISINLIEKNIATAYTESNLSPGTTDPTKFPITTKDSIGSKLTIFDGGIKIGVGVSKVIISAMVALSTNAQVSKNLYIYKNSIVVARAVFNLAVAIQPTIQITPKLIDVEENDIIYIYVSTGGSDTFSSSSSLTYLTVEVVA